MGKVRYREIKWSGNSQSLVLIMKIKWPEGSGGISMRFTSTVEKGMAEDEIVGWHH